MRCLKCFFAVLLLLATPVQAEARTTAFTMKQAVEHALDANPGVEAKLLALEKAKMDVGAAQSAFWPHVSLVWNRNKLDNTDSSGLLTDQNEYSQTSTSKGLRVSLNIFAGFQHLNSVQKAMLGVDYEGARHRQAKLELIANIQLQFLQLLKAREDMKTVEDSRKRITTQLAAARAFVNEGMAPYLNVLQNEVELSKVKQQEIRVINMIRNAEVVLNKYLGYDNNAKVIYRGRLSDFAGAVKVSEEEAIRVSLYSRPDLIMAQKSAAMALKQSHITAGRYLPTVNVTYDNMKYSRNYSSDAPASAQDYDRSYWNLGMNVNWDVFDGGGTTFTLLGDRKMLASLRKEYEDTMHSARAEVIRAMLDISAAKELITVSRKGMEAAKESYDMANQRYMTHTGTITDLLDAQYKLTEAEEMYNQAMTEYHSARVKFFYNVGMENAGLEDLQP